VGVEGAASYLPKPFTRAVRLARVREALAAPPQGPDAAAD
jgi:DNA-binding response OmpR family regulator